MSKTLYRSKTDRVIFGVCGGIAEYFGIDSTLVRIITVVLAMINTSFSVLYLILGLIMPENPSKKKGKPVVKMKNTLWIGAGLIIIGGLLLLDTYNVLNWNQIWPVLLIIIGGYLLWQEQKK
jgi:phage shock protein C